MWIEETKNGYRAVERYKDAFGKTKRVSVVMKKNTAQERNKAMAKLNNKIVSLQQPKEDTATLGELIDEFKNIKMRNLSGSAKASYSVAFKHLLKTYDENTDIRTITTRQLNVLFSNLGKVYKINTLKTYKIRISTLFNYAIEIELLSKNPVDKVTLSSDVKEEEKIKYLSKQQIEKLLSKLGNTTMDNLTRFLLFTGVRFGEAVALTWEDIDLDNKTATINKSYSLKDGVKAPKTKSSIRTIDLTDDIINMLKEMNTTNYVFESMKGKHLSLTTFIKFLNRIDFDIYLHPHLFRHTHISMLAELGVPIKAIMDRVGHSDSSTTLEIYTHVTDGMRTQLIDKLNNYCPIFAPKTNKNS